MKSLIVANPRLIPACSEKKVIELCQKAAKAEADYTIHAARAGFALMEYRAYLSDTSAPSDPSDLQGQGRIRHSGGSSLLGRNQHSEGHGFTAWLQTIGLPETTARRWMATTERVARHLLRIPLSQPFTPFIDVGGEVVPMSELVSLPPSDASAPSDQPESQLPAQAAEFRQSFFDFLADKSLAEAARAALEGESPAHRVTRAANGKTEGGHRGEDRKDFPAYAGSALADVLAHVGAKVERKGGHWTSLTAAQKHLTVEYFKLFLRGLPDDLVDYLQEASRIERTFRQKGQRPEPLALKAVVDKALGEKALKAAKA